MESHPTRRCFLAAAGGAVATPSVVRGEAGTTGSGSLPARGSDGGRQSGGDEPPVAAPDRRVLLDRGQEVVGSVVVDGEFRHVVRYDNPVPAATGIEVWGPEERIADFEAADRTLSTLAWSEVVATLRDRTPTIDRRFPPVVDASRRIDRRLGGAERALEWAVERIDELQEIGVDLGVREITVWDVLTRTYPSLRLVASGIRTAHDTLEGWTEAASAVRESLPALRTYLGGVEDVRRIDPATARSTVESARGALADVREQIRELLTAVQQVRNRARDALDALERSDERILAEMEAEMDVGIPSVAEDAVADAVREVTDALRSVLNRLFSDVVDPLLEPVRAFREDVRAAQEATGVDPSARTRRDRFRRAWRERSDATVVVNGMAATVGLLGTLVLASAWLEPVEMPGDADG